MGEHEYGTTSLYDKTLPRYTKNTKKKEEEYLQDLKYRG